MKPKMIWANLATDDLQRTLDFYTSLGFEQNVRMSTDKLVSISFADNGFIINFFVRNEVRDDLNGSIGKWQTPSEVLFSLSAKTREEVNEWPERVLSAGGTIVSPPQNFLEGYTFCFSDPDGHKFNVLYYPGM